jgi:hypothetical protein
VRSLDFGGIGLELMWIFFPQEFGKEKEKVD